MATSANLVEYEVGQRFGEYEVTRKEPLENVAGHYYELIHHKTGARHIHIAAPDDNNSFSVTFPTVPTDSTGVAHILEHVVLAGSQKFPVRDPFFSMTPRSLKTFMNALTASDATSYPFSTRNKKDFFNLLEVYLDATFFPTISEQSFKQEGHRFEFEQLEDASSGLRYKGVVFNEMKGTTATPGYVVSKAIGQAIFPDLTYAHISGGDPQVIPDLTWQQLRDFHAKHYHPTNSYFYTYGNLPLNEILDFIENNALSRFDKIDVDVSIGDQPRFDSPITLETSYPIGKDEDPSKKGQALVAWLTTLTADPFETFSFRVLGEVLLGNDASPLYKALIDSGLGDSLADGSGFHTNFRESVFAAGLKGMEPEDAEKVEAVVIDTLEKLVKEGIEGSRIDTAVHQLELRSREVSDAGLPYSLKLLFRLWPAYVYGGDPYRMLQFDDDISRLTKERGAGPYFENLIRRWLLDNPHRARVVVKPDPNLEEERRKAELKKLAKIEAALSEAQKASIVDETRALKQVQETKQDLSSLPTLELSDVPMEFEDVEHEIVETGGVRFGLFPQPTNGLSYVDLRMDFSSLSDALKERLALFSYAVTRSGAGKFDYLQMAQRIDAYTGGISASAGVRTGADGVPLQSFTLSGKALSRNHGPFLEILGDIVTGVVFDRKRIKDLIAEFRVEYEGFITFAGHLFAARLATSRLSGAAAMQERLQGLSVLRQLRELSEKSEDQLDSVVDELNTIRDHLFGSGGLNVCITTEEKHIEDLHKGVSSILNGSPREVPQIKMVSLDPVPGKYLARTTGSPVAYNAKAYKTISYAHPDAPALAALSHYLRTTYLHREIREKGGAYGGAAQFDQEGGLFIFLSWRDPNISRTFKVFDEAVAEVAKGDLDPQDVKEAILSICGAVDPLLSADTKGRVRFFDDLAGYTLELKRNFKKGLLGLTDKDLIAAAERHLTGEATMATLSNADKVNSANAELGEVFEVEPA